MDILFTEILNFAGGLLMDIYFPEILFFIGLECIYYLQKFLILLQVC